MELLGTGQDSHGLRYRDRDRDMNSCEISVCLDSDAWWIQGLDENPALQRKMTSADQDRRDMERMGKKQQLKRNFRELAAIGFTSCVMGTWEIFLTANTPGLRNGGLAGVFWSMVWATAGQSFVVLSLAEMSSMAPTAGGHLHWINEFADPQRQHFLSYCSSCLSLISWQSIFAVDCSIIGAIIQALIDLNDLGYTPTRWQTALLTIATAVVVAAFNAFAARHFSIAEGIFATCHVFLLVPIVVSLWVLGPKNSAREVFLTFTNNRGGWPSVTLSVLVGQLPSIFTVLRSDCVALIAEEIEGASMVVPRCMVWSFFLNVPLTFIILTNYLFNVTSIPDIVDASCPFVKVFEAALDSTEAATAFSIVVLALLVMVSISAMASTSRQLFAFARENGLPFSSWISKINPRHRVPVNAIVTTAAFTVALSFLYIASGETFNALLSLATISQMATYMIALGCIVLKRLRHEPMPVARWSLGRASLAINCLGLFYSCWAFFWSLWPSHYKFAAETFDWSGLLFAALVAVALILYRTGGKNRYLRPVKVVREVASSET